MPLARHGPVSRVTAEIQQQLRAAVCQQPDITLWELQEHIQKASGVGLSCWHTPCVTAAHTVDRLAAVGLRALVLSQHDELLTTQERLLSRENEIEHLTAHRQAAASAVWTQVREAGSADRTTGVEAGRAGVGQRLPSQEFAVELVSVASSRVTAAAKLAR